MISDYHMHSEFSTDSDTPMELMAERAIALGMKRICFTDHMDMEFPGGGFQLDTPLYMAKVRRLKKTYEGRLDILSGVELGMQSQLVRMQEEYVAMYPFDFVIGSMHLLHGQDPYDRKVFEGRTDAEVYEEYFLETLENVKRFSGFQTLGHLDYVVRYGARQAEEYSYSRYADIIDEILKILVQRGCGLELNTGGIKYGLGFPNPHPDILRRFRELGGDIVTVGADAHRPEHVGYAFEQVREYLKNAGFAYVAEFQGRKPEFIKI